MRFSTPGSIVVYPEAAKPLRIMSEKGNRYFSEPRPLGCSVSYPCPLSTPSYDHSNYLNGRRCIKQYVGWLVSRAVHADLTLCDM